MRDSRGLSVAHNELRELWFGGLELPNKEEALFELEMLMKGAVCFGEEQNHPGPRKREPPETRQFAQELRALQLACERITDLTEMMLVPEGDRTSSDIYLLSGPLENVSRPLLGESFVQETPDHSLGMIFRAFSDLSDLLGVMTRLERIPYRGFRGVAMVAGREVSRNLFFNPLVSLEFRTEYDQLQHLEILHIVYGGGPEGAQRAATLSFLSLFRLLRYLRYVDLYLEDAGSASLACVPLAVARNDAMALSTFMRDEARRWLSGEFEREVMTLSAQEIIEAAPGLKADYKVLRELGSTLRAVGDQLNLQVRRTFEHSLPLLSEMLASDEMATTLSEALRELREFLMHSVIAVAQVFKPALTGEQVFDDFVGSRADAVRMRRDTWMFSQILRGFLAKAAAAPETANRWMGNSSYRFVREFITYFRNLGYHLIRVSSYERFNEFMKQVESLSATEVIDQDAVEVFVYECEAFQSYLLSTFESLDESVMLADLPFDRHGAAVTLRLYLDRG